MLNPLGGRWADADGNPVAPTFASDKDRVIHDLQRVVEEQRRKLEARDAALAGLAEQARGWHALGSERHLVVSAILELLADEAWAKGTPEQ